MKGVGFVGEEEGGVLRRWVSKRRIEETVGDTEFQLVVIEIEARFLKESLVEGRERGARHKPSTCTRAHTVPAAFADYDPSLVAPPFPRPVSGRSLHQRHRTSAPARVLGPWWRGCVP